MGALGIATYSVVGAQVGTNFLWTALLTRNSAAREQK
jgi:hypothetical protein